MLNPSTPRQVEKKLGSFMKQSLEPRSWDSWGNDHLPFNLKGGVMIFSQKNILIPNDAEKNILILVEENKNNLIQSFCHIT